MTGLTCGSPTAGQASRPQSGIASSEPFQRLGDRDNHTGVGLGLALARGLTEAMNGTLIPDDTPGGSLTMILTLPAAMTPAGPEARDAMLETRRRPGDHRSGRDPACHRPAQSLLITSRSPRSLVPVNVARRSGPLGRQPARMRQMGW